MIIEFSVQNFGSIKEKQTLSFEAKKNTNLEDYYVIHAAGGLRLLKLVMIYGANASGKTTILNALDFLRALVLNPAEKKTDELDYTPFLFDANTPVENSIFTIDFLQQGIRYAYEVEFNKTAIVKEQLHNYDPGKAVVFRRTTDIDSQFSQISFGSKIKTDKTVSKVLTANTLWNNTVLGGFLKTNIENKELTDAQRWFSDYLKKIITPNADLEMFVTGLIREGAVKKNDVINILKKADFQISDLNINEQEQDIPEGLFEFLEKTIRVSKERVKAIQSKGKLTSLNVELEHTVEGIKYSLPIEEESQGTQRYYGFAGILALMIKDRMGFMIDELESSLHPDLYNHFILSFLINVRNSQLLCTTHNREILSNKEIFRNDAIWFTDKSECCATKLYSLADFDSKTIRDTSSVYNAYKIGKLGGVPNLGDYYIDITDGEER